MRRLSFRDSEYQASSRIVLAGVELVQERLREVAPWFIGPHVEAFHVGQSALIGPVVYKCALRHCRRAA